MRWEGVMWGGSEETERKLELCSVSNRYTVHMYETVSIYFHRGGVNVQVKTQRDAMWPWVGTVAATRSRKKECINSILGPPVGAAPISQHLELRLLAYRRVRECKVLFLVTQPVIPYSNQRKHRWILSLFPFTDEESEEITQSVWEMAGLPAFLNSVAVK